jgi:DNA-binding NtrC family response regulator
MKARDPRAKIVMATAYASIELAVDAMKLGATDFVRKPFTPETLRNAVAAALTKQSVAREDKADVSESIETAEIETITMNGFSIRDVSESISPTQKRFIVLNPTGSQHEVVVEITDELLRYVQRIIKKNLPAESTFWTSQARLLLSNYLWEKGEVPKMKTLILAEIDRNTLFVAERWT